MTVKTKSTVKMICARAGIASVELTKEAQRLLEAYQDPNVPHEQKVIVKAKLDAAIQILEERVTTRRLREASGCVDESEEQAG